MGKGGGGGGQLAPERGEPIEKSGKRERGEKEGREGGRGGVGGKKEIKEGKGGKKEQEAKGAGRNSQKSLSHSKISVVLTSGNSHAGRKNEMLVSAARIVSNIMSYSDACIVIQVTQMITSVVHQRIC